MTPTYYRVTLTGISPLIMHNGAAGMDKRSPANIEKAEISRKKTTDRTEADDERMRELQCQTSLWLHDGAPTVEASAIRKCLETAARKLKQGAQVREGMTVWSVDGFDYDKRLGTTMEELGRNAQFTVPVVVQRSRVERTRAKFDAWSVTFTIEADAELIDQRQLESWLEIAGRRIGVGNWRPEKSGTYGRFTHAVTRLHVPPGQ